MKNNILYLKLAFTNIKNNSKTYFPFIITCIGTILMFYNIMALAFNSSTSESETLSILMNMGTVISGIFSVIFIFYTNSFLVKRRKKEFGLYNVLGMEKKHIGKVMFWENSLVSVTSIAFGLIFGILISKMITLLLYKMLHFDPTYKFEVNLKAIGITAILFLGVFLLTLISSLIQVYRSKPLELLNGGSVGEREPKTNWFLTVIGLVSLGSGYYIALTVKNPIEMVTLFMVAVILVIIGTYALFTAGSIVLLKALKKNKTFYYKTKNFVSLSSMLYRMRRNAVGLANICAMSTAVLVMISTTVSMYVGMEDMMKVRYPKDTSVTIQYKPDIRPSHESLEGAIKISLNENEIAYSNFSGYEYREVVTFRDGNKYTVNKSNNPFDGDNVSVITMMSSKDVEKITGEKVDLLENEVMLVSERNEKEIEFLGETFIVKQTLEEMPVIQFGQWLVDEVCVIVDNEETMDRLYYKQIDMYGGNTRDMYYNINFDFNEPDDNVIEYYNGKYLNEVGKEFDYAFRYDIKQVNKAEFYELYGGLFFLGIFLGFLFLIATVLIIYYKQVIEGYEDKERFRIMQNVGMSKAEVRKSINSQVLTVFAIPIVAAAIHILFAFPILTRLLALLNLTNVPLFAAGTVATVVVFAMFYVIVYYATSKVYYKIVKG